jgi:hypothetical protein
MIRTIPIDFDHIVLVVSMWNVSSMISIIRGDAVARKIIR